jgi:hypothetical protein
MGGVIGETTVADELPPLLRELAGCADPAPD